MSTPRTKVSTRGRRKKIGRKVVGRPHHPPGRKATIGPELTSPLITEIGRAAEKSKLAKYSWPNGQVARIGYVKGMACVFASFYVRLLRGDKLIAEMTRPKGRNSRADVLGWYAEQFDNAGMDNSHAGTDILKNLFAFMFCLGMLESGGAYCRGRTKSSPDMTAETAPAGLFQCTSELCKTHVSLSRVIAKYSADPTGFLEVFREDVVCRPQDWENVGSGKGFDFQRLTKASPAFAVEYAALGLRHRRDHWQSITQRKVVLPSLCATMFGQIQRLVDKALGRPKHSETRSAKR